jgi:hypothetical protein
MILTALAHADALLHVHPEALVVSALALAAWVAAAAAARRRRVAEARRRQG